MTTRRVSGLPVLDESSSASPNPSRNPNRVSALPTPDTASGHPLSIQQEAVIDWARTGRGSAFVEAVAGSGKTTTLLATCAAMGGSVALAAFNKAIADEIKTKLRRQGSDHVHAATFHSFGYSAWRRKASHVRVEAREKRWRMMEDCGVEGRLQSAVGTMVSIAKQSVVDLVWRTDDVATWQDMIDHHDILWRVDEDPYESEDETRERLIETAEECVRWSRRVGGDLIDFDDMLWLPLVEGLSLYRNDWVLVDEAQDTNLARRMLAERMVKPNGRTLWVGDRHQAIYGFQGADADAVQQIVDRFECRLLPLTVTFRCSKAATELAQRWVPEIEAHEDNNAGRVDHLSGSELLRIATRGGAASHDYPLRPGDAILCRLNRPLVALAFRLIREGIGCYVEGRDIGKQLERLATKWKVNEIPELAARLEEYRRRETARLAARRADHLVAALNDRIDTLTVLMEGCYTVDELRARIEKIFKDRGGPGTRDLVVLSTIHKAKGREWDRVFILGWDVYMPSKWARQPWEKQQEANLQYVAVTRTRRDLVLVGALDG